MKSKVISIIQNIRRLKKGFNKKESPDNLFKSCPKCKELLEVEKLSANSNTCSKCNYHFEIDVYERLALILDEYKIINDKYKFKNPINFKDYEKKYKDVKKKTDKEEAVVIAKGKIKDINIVVGVLDNSFFMGSMGTYLGEQITKAFEYASLNNYPILIFSTSGGARMQEGIYSLMQMAKTSMAVKKFHESKNLYISCMLDKTTGGVTASFASLGDINIAEPSGLIGFAGPRVIKQTINQELEEGFQSAEYLLENGFLDDVVDRKYLKTYIEKLLRLHGYGSD